MVKYREEEWSKYLTGAYANEADREDLSKIVVRVCDECKQTKECMYEPDPYIEEIEDRKVMKWLCHPCYEDIYGDI